MGKRRGFYWIALGVLMMAQSAWSQNISWIRQFGSAADDFAFGASSDASGVFVAGYTEANEPFGALPCMTGNVTSSVEGFARRYNSAGVLSLTDPNAPFEIAYDVAGDGTGAHYVVGASPHGTGQAFVRLYSSSGALVTTRYFGASSQAFGVAIDSTGVYVAGFAINLVGAATGADAFVRKYDLALSAIPLWTASLGGADTDSATAVAVDATGVYVSGYSGLGGLSGADGFLSKRNLATGALLWDRQISTSSDDFAFGVTVGLGSVYVSGDTSGALTAQPSAGLSDAFVRKYDASGTAQWTNQFGTTSADFAVGVAANASGVYVSGYTGGALGLPVGDADAYVRKYETGGVEIWTTQFGTAAADLAWDVAADGDAVYASGCTAGTLGASSAGGSDAYLAKLEPGLLVLIDIKPGTFPNSINLGSNGLVPVAILSSATFDATTVDPMSISLAGASVKLKSNGSYQSSVQDVNGDSLLDLVVHVITDALVLSSADTDAVLKSVTFSGQTIHGKDSIRVVP